MLVVDALEPLTAMADDHLGDVVGNSQCGEVRPHRAPDIVDHPWLRFLPQYARHAPVELSLDLVRDAKGKENQAGQPVGATVETCGNAATSRADSSRIHS